VRTTPIMDPCLPPTMQSMLETPKTTKSRMATINDEGMDVKDKLHSCETPIMPSKTTPNSALYYKTFPKRSLHAKNPQVAKFSNQEPSGTVRTTPATQNATGFSPLQHWRQEAQKQSLNSKSSPNDSKTLSASHQKKQMSCQYSLPIIPTATAFKSITTASNEPKQKQLGRMNTTRAPTAAQHFFQGGSNQHQAAANAIIPPKKEGDSGLELCTIED